MKTKDLATLTSVALGTATLTVLLFWSASLEAGKEEQPLAAKIDQPKLVLNGAEFTLAAAQDQPFQAGDRPEFVLQAINPSGEPVTVDLLVAMTGMARMSELSRVMPMPAMLWQSPCTLTLAPNETKTLTLPTDTEVPANQLIQVTLRNSEGTPKPALANGSPQGSIPPQRGAAPRSSIVALSFSTTTPESQPMVTVVQDASSLVPLP